MGGLGTADQKTMSLPRVLGPAVEKGRSLYPKGQRRRWLHRKPSRPFGYRLLERSRDGHGVCFTWRLNGWVRGVFWEKCRPIASQKRESKPAAMRG